MNFKTFLFSLICFFCFQLESKSQNIQSPDSYLGYSLGSKYTPHYKIIDYFKYLSSNSTLIKFMEYGKTNEGRPLVVCFISSPENLKNLEEIRKNNYSLSGLDPSSVGVIHDDTPLIVWLSYNVHGNEPSSSEASMKTAYELLSKGGSDYSGLLKKTVVIIDPCINPDGRDRYVNFYTQASGEVPDPMPGSREHREPWPGGRFNHYLFDLNRDWAWQTQKETQARIKIYNSWLPQVHVDYHEMGINSHYYFSPAGEPFHSIITPWQRKFQEVVGEANANAFEKNGWLYFNREDFDLLYPSYGDTYPIYNGSIGMTYEQAGGPQGGVSIIVKSGDTLTLTQRIQHHFTTGIATIKSSNEHAGELLKEFKQYFSSSKSNPSGPYKAYVLKFKEGDQGKKADLESLLTRNGILFGSAKAEKNLEGFGYVSGKTVTFGIDKEDLVISAYQPKSRLLEALMEPKTYLSDSVTYDITGWAIPYSWGIEAYALNKGLAVEINANEKTLKEAVKLNEPSEQAYAYLLDWTGLSSVKALSYLWKSGVKVRYLEEPLILNARTFPQGTLVITQESNHNLNPGLGQIMAKVKFDFGLRVTAISSAFSKTSTGLASKKVHFLAKPEIGIVYGSSIDPSAYGEEWQFFEQSLGFPSHQIALDNLNARTLKNVNVLIIPNLENAQALKEDALNSLESWINAGGKLIALEGTISRLTGEKGFNIKARPADTTTKLNKVIDLTLPTYSDNERKSLRNSLAGSIYKVQVDNTNPLFFGFPNVYYSLKNASNIYEYLGKEKGWNAGVFKKDAYTSGFSGDLFNKQIQNSFAFGWQDYGAGSVVYLTDDPIFRSFWENGKLLFANAVFMVGN